MKTRLSNWFIYLKVKKNTINIIKHWYEIQQRSVLEEQGVEFLFKDTMVALVYSRPEGAPPWPSCSSFLHSLPGGCLERHNLIWRECDSFVTVSLCILTNCFLSNSSFFLNPERRDVNSIEILNCMCLFFNQFWYNSYFNLLDLICTTATLICWTLHVQQLL